MTLSHPLTTAAEPIRKLLLDIIEARTAVDLESIALAAERTTPQLTTKFDHLLKEALSHREDSGVLHRITIQIHLMNASASANSVLRDILEVILDLFLNEQRLLLDIHGYPRSNYDEHKRLVEAVRHHHKAVAISRMRKHLDGVQKDLLAWNRNNDHPTERR